MQVGRTSGNCDHFDRRGVGCDRLERRDQCVERVGQNVEELAAERPGSGSLRVYPHRPEREMAVDLRDRAQLGEATDQAHEGWIAHLLVTGAHSQATLARDGEQLPCLALRLDEGLLDVDVCASEQGLARGFKVGARRGAHVDERGSHLPQQVGQRRVGDCACLRGELPGRAVPRIANGGDDVR